MLQKRHGQRGGRCGGEHFVWNTGGLRADIGLVRGGGWAALDAEAQQERRSSQRKIEWLRMHVTQSEPTVVFLEEVTGSLTEATTGLRMAFSRMGYATLVLPSSGAGGGAGTELSRENCIFAAVAGTGQLSLAAL